MKSVINKTGDKTYTVTVPFCLRNGIKGSLTLPYETINASDSIPEADFASIEKIMQATLESIPNRL